MTGELDPERAALRVLFSNDPTLASLTELYAIEDHASSTDIEKAFTNEVTDSDVLILILNKELRPAVEKEYLTAKQRGVRPIVFIRNRTDKRDPGLTDFISNQAYQYHCGSFNDAADLCVKVKTAILNDVVNTYCRTSPKSDLPPPPPFVQLGTGPRTGASLFDYQELEALREHPELSQFGSEQLVALAMHTSDQKWDFRTALLLLELAIAKDPTNWQAFHNKGQLLSEIGLDDDSLVFLERALELNPASHPTLHNIGIYHYHHRNSGKAREYFERAVALFPAKYSSLSYLVNIAIEQENYAEALAHAQCAFAHEKGELERANLALAYALNNQIDAARATLGKPATASKEFFRASALVEEIAGDLVAALGYLEEYFRVYGLEHFLCIKKANYIIRAARISELRDWLQVVARAMHIPAADYNNLGYTLLNQKSDVPLAAELFERAVAIDPTMVVAWKNLQCCYESGADLERAIEVSKRALKHHPNDPGVFGNMAQALLRSGRLVEYIDFFVDKMISFFGNSLPADQRERIKQEAMSKVDTGDLRQIENLVRSMIGRTSQEK